MAPARGPSPRWLTTVERELARWDRRIELGEWGLAVGRPDPDYEENEAARREILTSSGFLERVRRARADAGSDRTARRLELLERTTLATAIEQDREIVRVRTRLARAIGAFRPRWNGRRVGRAVVRAALRTDPRRNVRERAYRAEEALYRPLEPALRELVALRNERARSLGYRSFPEFLLGFEGFTPSALERLIERAVRHVPEAMRLRRDEFQARTGERGWYPWDLTYSDHLAGGLPDRAFPSRGMLGSVLAAVRRWGFSPGALRFRVARHDLAAGGMCIAPDRPRDVRIVVHPAGGWRHYRVLFHEVGHAVTARSVRQPTHLLRGSPHVPGFGGLAEGEGRFFEQIATSPRWLQERTELDRATIDAAVATLGREPLLFMAYHARWIRTELALYLRPDRDPSALDRRLARELFGTEAAEPLSYANSFVIELPLYAPSYLYAELLRPQLAAAALADVGGELWPNPRVGPWLVDRWFRDGRSYDWGPRLAALTGRSLGAEAFNEEMASRLG